LILALSGVANAGEQTDDPLEKAWLAFAERPAYVAFLNNIDTASGKSMWPKKADGTMAPTRVWDMLDGYRSLAILQVPGRKPKETAITLYSSNGSIHTIPETTRRVSLPRLHVDWLKMALAEAQIVLLLEPEKTLANRYNRAFAEKLEFWISVLLKAEQETAAKVENAIREGKKAAATGEPVKAVRMLYESLQYHVEVPHIRGEIRSIRESNPNLSKPDRSTECLALAKKAKNINEEVRWLVEAVMYDESPANLERLRSVLNRRWEQQHKPVLERCDSIVYPKGERKDVWPRALSYLFSSQSKAAAKDCGVAWGQYLLADIYAPALNVVGSAGLRCLTILELADKKLVEARQENTLVLWLETKKLYLEAQKILDASCALSDEQKSSASAAAARKRIDKGLKECSEKCDGKVLWNGASVDSTFKMSCDGAV